MPATFGGGEGDRVLVIRSFLPFFFFLFFFDGDSTSFASSSSAEDDLKEANLALNERNTNKIEKKSIV